MNLQNNVRKRMLNADSDFEKVVLFGMFSLTLLITLFPFFKMGFTCADDFEYYNTLLSGKLAEDAQYYARMQGRFYFLITKPFYSLAYVFDNFMLNKFLQLFCLLLAYGSFAYLIKKLTRSKVFAMATGLFLLMATPITINLHLPFFGYPCYFTFSFALFCLGCTLIVKYYETERYGFMISGAVVLFCAMLFYEVYLLFLLFLACFLLGRYWYVNGIRGSLTSKKFYKELLPVVCCGCLYAGLYLFYRMQSPSAYTGNMVSSDFSLKNFFIILFNCTKGVFPLQNFRQMASTMVQNSTLYEGHYKSLLFALTHAPLLAYVNAVLQMLLLCWLVRKMENMVSWKQLAVFVFLGAVLAFSSHILIAVTPKYNNDWYSWMSGYVTSFYSYFFIMLALVCIGYALLKVCYKVRILFWSCFVVLLGIVGMGSVINQYTNEHASRAWQLYHQRFVVLDEMFKVDAFQSLTAEDIVYVPEFCVAGHVGTIFLPQSWSDYVRTKYHPACRFCFSQEELCNLTADGETPQANLYYLQHLDACTANEHLLVLAPVVTGTFEPSAEDPLAEALCDSATIYYYSPAKNFTLLFDVPQAVDSTVAVLDYQDTVFVRQGLNTYPVNYIYWNFSRTPLSVCNIQCRGMRAKGFGVMNMMRLEEAREINPYWRSVR